MFCAVTTQARAQAPSAASAVRPSPLHIATRVLPNGLRMVMVEDHSTPIINLQVWYHVGSKDERPGRTGFAHLFEHLMFQGSTHVPPEQHTRIVEAMGGVSNAYTTEDATVFFETFPSNYLARALWLEADRMGGLTVTAENFSSEREVVKEERRLRVDNQPYGQVWEDLDAVAFTVHPYHHPVIGNMEDLNKATVDDVREFFRAFYRPDNATLVLVGDFSADDAVREAGLYFGGIPKPAQPIVRIAVSEPPQQAERRVTKSYPDTPLPAVVMAYRMPAMFTPDAYPLELASNILSNGESSLLYRKLVYDDRIAIQADGGGNFTEDPNLFIALAVMNQGKTAAEGEKAIVAVLGQLKDSSVEANDLEKAKNQQIADSILGQETVQSKASALGRYAVLGGDPDRFNTELDRYLRVTAADVQRVARDYFVPAQRTVLVVAPPPAADKAEKN
jgi:zinc protease